MTRKVITVSRATSLRDIIQIFRKCNFQTLPVVGKNNRLVGIITFDEILKVFQPYSSDLAAMLKSVSYLESSPVEELQLDDISGEMGMLVVADDIVSDKFVTVGQETAVGEAHAMMRRHNTRVLLVTQEEELAGIICLFDIILALLRERGVVE